MSKFKAVAVTDEFDYCTCCGRQGLKRVVMMLTLDADGNVLTCAEPFGTTCAARLLGYSKPTDPKTKKKVEVEANKFSREEMARKDREIRQLANIGDSVEFDLEDGYTLASVVINGEVMKVKCNWNVNGIYDVVTVKQVALTFYANKYCKSYR